MWIPPKTDAEALERRRVLLEAVLPDWRRRAPVLYVGIHPGRAELLDELAGPVELLEVHGPSLAAVMAEGCGPGTPLPTVVYGHVGDVTVAHRLPLPCRRVACFADGCEAVPEFVLRPPARFPDLRVPVLARGGRWRLAVWWHGPEHATQIGAMRALDALRDISDAVLVGCPVGDFPQGPVGANPYQAHVSAWEPSDFERLGFRVAHEGRGRGSSLVAAWDSR